MADGLRLMAVHCTDGGGLCKMPNGCSLGVSQSREWTDLETDATATHVRSTEEALVRRAQRGDSDAFADLVRLYQRRVVSVAYRLLGNIEDASDVSQDAFIRAYRNLSQLDDPSRFGGWLMRAVSNLSLNYRRARKIRSTASLDDVLTGAAEVRSPGGQRSSGGSPVLGRASAIGVEDEGGPLADELRAAIGEAMERLPDKQRVALILFSVEGMPQKEVAEILECSIELVKWNVFQARRKLKEMLKPFL